jgi:hypothetical protein
VLRLLVESARSHFEINVRENGDGKEGKEGIVIARENDGKGGIVIETEKCIVKEARSMNEKVGVRGIIIVVLMTTTVRLTALLVTMHERGIGKERRII